MSNYIVNTFLTRNILILVIFLSLLVSSCTTSTRITATWQDPYSANKYNNIFILMFDQNLATRLSVEKELTSLFLDSNYKATASSSVLPPDIDYTNAKNQHIVNDKFMEIGCDAILTVNIMDKQTSVNYVPDTYWYGYYGAWGGSPGYYTTNNTYFISINIYDIKQQKLVWTAQCETSDLSDLQQNAYIFAGIVFNNIKDSGILSTKK